MKFAGRQSAVLLILYPRDGEVNILLTQRSMSVAFHRGEISFPGGVLQNGDEDLLFTAIRETHEEVGVQVTRDNVVGMLDDVWTVVTNYVITPYIVIVDQPPTPILNHSEVTKVLEVPLRELLKPDSLKNETVMTRDGSRKVRAFSYQGHTIWGATAQIVKQFLDLLGESNVARSLR